MGTIVIATGFAFLLSRITAPRLSRHNSGVQRAARELRWRGCHVAADHIAGETRPPILNGRRPDVLAKCGVLEVAVEVETAESINTKHSREQIRDLRRWKNRKRSRRLAVSIV